MPSGPPKAFERAVALLLPPACREEVLGDLYEQYTGPGQYIVLALITIPFVIVSRILRTTDAQVLLTEALLVYGSYLAAGWYTDRTSLAAHGALLRLVIPTVLLLVDVVLYHAWAPEKNGPIILIQGVAFGISAWINLYGVGASLLLVSAVEILFQQEAKRPQRAAGLPVFTEPAVLSADTKRILTAAGFVILAAIILIAAIGSRFGRE